MAKRQYFLIIDTETSNDDRVSDFGAVVCDRKGNIYASCGVLVKGVFDMVPLFSMEGTIFNNGPKRMEYNSMLESRERILVSVDAINRWLVKVLVKFNPTVTAYNLAFDWAKCKNTGIDLTIFEGSFCLWHLAADRICGTKAYTQFCLDHRRITPKLNLKTDAETVAGFVKGDLIIEPHTALEDARDFELPILVHIAKKRKGFVTEYAYHWKDWTLRSKVVPVTRKLKV